MALLLGTADSDAITRTSQPGAISALAGNDMTAGASGEDTIAWTGSLSGKRITTGRPGALVELNKQLTVEGPRTSQEQEKDAALEMDVREEAFDRRDFLVLMVSIAVLAFGMWWVAPW